MSNKQPISMFLGLLAVATAFAATEAHGGIVTNVFDLTSGTNTYHGLNDFNWTEAFAGVNPNSGTEFLASANGNKDFTFVDIGITKELGGVIEDQPYQVSFFITKYFDLSGVEFSDFSSLFIGGFGGTMIWESTPTPTINGVWVQWTGVYTPSASDVGEQFIFEAIFDLDGLHTIAIDGLIVAAPPDAGDCSDFPCGNNDNKVVLCHVPPGNPANAHTLCISPNAVAAHLENHGGDHCGPCDDDDDSNADGAVDVLDLIDLLLCFGRPSGLGCESNDRNGDGMVNVLDLIDLLLVFGTASP